MNQTQDILDIIYQIQHRLEQLLITSHYTNDTSSFKAYFLSTSVYLLNHKDNFFVY